MEPRTKTCQNCKSPFVIEPDDFAFYEKIKVPPPTFCPECRLVRRLIFRNERTLYKRKCDFCGEEKVMMYPADAPFPVYCRPCWWSDKWDARSYARDYDPARPFLEQFRELFLTVPRAGNINQKNVVGSDYTNRATDIRNSYLVFGATRVEDCRYSSFVNDAKGCMDCYNVRGSERCYECVDCSQCYNLAFSQESNTCTDSWFMFQCNNCQDCFGCVNLRNKRYCIWNEQYTKEEYMERIRAMDLKSATNVEAARRRFAELKAKFIVPWSAAYHNTNVSGNWLQNCKNVRDSFICNGVEEGRFCFSVFDAKDAMDHTFWGNHCERTYGAANVGIQCANVRFSSECWEDLREAEYCMNCHGSHDLFGCVGIRKGEFSILNKQYAPEEYRALCAKIRVQMDGMPYVSKNRNIEYRYGEFFPPEFSPHAYNEALSQQFFPLAKEEAVRRGYIWRDEPVRSYGITMPAANLPDRIEDAADTIAEEIVGCPHGVGSPSTGSGQPAGAGCTHQCTTAFRITAEDLAIHRVARLPLPRLCPNCRHYERIAMRTPLRLWKRECMCGSADTNDDGDDNNDIGYGHSHRYRNTTSHFHGSDPCQNEFETSYPPESNAIVYCEQCYNAEVA